MKNCPIKDIQNKLCILKNRTNEKDDDIKQQDMILKNIEDMFTSSDYDTTNLDKGEDEIIFTEKMTITLTTTQNQKDNMNNNMTIIDIGECENLLRKEYSLSKNDILYMKKIDVVQTNMKIPKIEYDVYCKLNGSNLIKLDLTICVNSKLSLSIPVELTESLDELNSKSGYYNDICYVTTSEEGTDISLKDRKKNFIVNNKTICQDNCGFEDYEYETKKVKCSCNVKQSPKSFADMNINKTKLYESFIDIKNIANINMLKCYKILFKKKSLIKNIGSYFMIIVIIIHIIFIFIFYGQQLRKIKKMINKIFSAIKYLKTIKSIKFVKTDEKKNKNKQEQDTSDNKIITESKEETKKIKQKNKKVKNKNNKNKSKKKSKVIELNISNSSGNSENSNNKIKTKNDKNKKIKGRNNIDNYLVKSKEKNKLKKVMEYNDEEMNELPYNLAKQYDKRNFCQFYFSLLKTKHNILFTFFNNNDYNSIIIKIDLFIIDFTINYWLNVLFYTDDIMHNIYLNKGSFDFVYQLPKIIYSSLIAMILNGLLRILALSSIGIINFKKNKSGKKIKKKKKVLNKTLKIKFTSYFLISSLFLIFFWYYLSMFGAIYRNTQYHLLKDTLISFGFSLIYPFGLYLLPGIFRIPSLSKRKGKREIMYNFSKILQIF